MQKKFKYSCSEVYSFYKEQIMSFVEQSSEWFSCHSA